MHGQGTMTYLNGSEYVGNWIDGKRNGQGTMILMNGREIVGDFTDGIFGNGIYKLATLMDVWDGICFWYYKIVE